MSARKRAKRRNDNAEEERSDDTAPEDEGDPEEENMNKALSDAGIELDGMSKDEKKQIYEMLQASKAQYEREEELRKIVDSPVESDDEGQMPSTSHTGKSKKKKRKTLTRRDSVEFDDANEKKSEAVKRMRNNAEDKEESFNAVLQLSMDSQEEDMTKYDDNAMDETDVHQNVPKLKDKTATEGPFSVTIIDDESMDETVLTDLRKSKLSQSQAGETINTEVSMDLTCLSNENSGKQTHRAHNITDFESKSMNETNLAMTRTASPKVWDQTDTEAVSMEETMAHTKESDDKGVEVMAREKEPVPKAKKKRRKCMLLISESDTEREDADKSVEEKVNVSLQCSLPSGEENTQNQEKNEEEVDVDDSDESVVFSGDVKGDVVAESVLHTPEKKRIVLGSSEDGVIPETQEYDRSSSPILPGSNLSVGEMQDRYYGETLDPTGDIEYDNETEEGETSPNIFSPVRSAAKKALESVESVMSEPTRDDEDELAAAEAVLVEEEEEEEEEEEQRMEDEEDIDDDVPLMGAQKGQVVDRLGPLNFECDYKVKTLTDKEVSGIIDKLTAPKPKEFDAYDPPQDSDDEAEGSDAKKGPSSPPVPSLVNKRRLKRRLYDPCPMYAPPGVNETNYALRISKYWEDYAKSLRAAQGKCHVCLPWGEPVQAGEHAKKTIDLATGDVVSDDEIEFTTASTRDKRYADRENKRTTFLAQFNMPGKTRKEQQSPVDETLPDLTSSLPCVTSSPKQQQTLLPASDTDDEFEVVAPKRKRGRAAGTGRGRGRGKREERSVKKLKRPQSNIMEYLKAHESDDEERMEIEQALSSARDELAGAGAWPLSERRNKYKSPSKTSRATNEDDIATENKEEQEEDDALANLSGQATFADDGISISSDSNRTTPAERMLNFNRNTRTNDPHQQGDNGTDHSNADRNSSGDLEIEIPDDSLENSPKVGDKRAANYKDDRQQSEVRVLSSDEETQDPGRDIDAPRDASPQNDVPLFQDSPERIQAAEKSMVKLTDGKLDFRRVTRKRKNYIPPFNEDGHVNRAVKIGNRTIVSPHPKRVKSESDYFSKKPTIFDFDADTDDVPDDVPIHLQWDKGKKNLLTYSRKGRGKKITEREREPDEESTDPPQEPVSMVACPLCLKEFPQEEVERHAANCFGDSLSDADAEQPIPGSSRHQNQTPQKRKREQDSDDEELDVLEDPVQALKRPPIHRKRKGEPKAAKEPKKGRARKKQNVEGKSRKSPVEVEELEDSDAEDQPPKSPTTHTPSKENEPTQECFICSSEVPQSRFESHVMLCLDRTEKEQQTKAEQKRNTRQKMRKT